MEHLAERGYDVLRSSGSRGAVDVVAVGDAYTLWIQAKITNPQIPPAERRAIVALAERARRTGFGGDSLPLVAYRVGGRVAFRLLTGAGPKDWKLFEPLVHHTAVCDCGHDKGDHAAATGCWGREATCGCRAFVFPSDAARERKAAERRTTRRSTTEKKDETQ